MLRLEYSLLRGIAATLLVLAHAAFQVDFVFADDLFPDKNLEAAVRKEVFEKRYNTEPLTADDVKNISQVVGKSKGIQNLEGIQHCKALMKLDLEKNDIVDLSPIKDLKQLQYIDLSSNKIEKIDHLSGLVNSQYLQLSKNSISDITPLRDMSNLRSLYLADNKIKSLEPLSVLKKIWSLDVSGNPVEDPAPIGKLKGLESINLKGCGIKSVEFTRALTPNFLMLSGNGIVDYGPLVEACEEDAKSANRFAPFLRLYLDDVQVKEASQSNSLERLKTARVKINPK